MQNKSFYKLAAAVALVLCGIGGFLFYDGLTYTVTTDYTEAGSFYYSFDGSTWTLYSGGSITYQAGDIYFRLDYTVYGSPTGIDYILKLTGFTPSTITNSSVGDSLRWQCAGDWSGLSGIEVYDSGGTDKDGPGTIYSRSLRSDIK